MIEVKVYVEATRPSTGSKLIAELPSGIVQEVEKTGDTCHAVEWVGKEFNWQFIPVKFLTMTLQKDNGKENKEIQ